MTQQKKKYKIRNPKNPILEGTRFGLITATGNYRLTKQGRGYEYQGFCSCPNKGEVWATGYEFHKNKVRSCGCSQKACLLKAALNRRLNIPKENSKFGNLLVLSETNIIGKTKVKCRCVCGLEIFVPVNSLLNGRRTGCGKAACRGNVLVGSIVATNSLYCNYEKGAARRGFSFDLSKEEFSKIILENCYYCDCSPQNQHNLTRKFARNISFSYNGLDRFDNSLGYISTNVVPCCYSCNIAKHKMSAADYIKRCRLVANLHQGKIL